MKTTKNLIAILFIATTLTSCNVDFLNRVQGNRNVITKQRKVNEDFTRVKVGNGLDLYVSQGDTNSITVEADENLHELIITEFRSGMLKIYSEKNIGRAKAKKVYVTIKNLEELKASSGSNLYSQNTLDANSLDISVSSGASMKVEVKANTITASSSSGADMRLIGEADNFEGSASSGSSTKANKLKVRNATVKASSGGDISIHTTESINARASSGGDIRYYGEPKTVSKNSSSGGSIHSRS